MLCQFRAKARVSVKVRRVDFADFLFGILRKIKHFRYEVDQEVDIRVVYWVIGKVQKPNVDESVPELV